MGDFLRNIVDCLVSFILIMEQDKKIRESFYKRDKDFNDTIRAEM